MEEVKVKYCLLITFKCDWDCSYCIVDTHNQDEPKPQDIFDSIDSLKNGSLVSLAGGEPGMAKKEFLVEIIQRLLEKNCNIHMDTNGLFFRRYPELVKYIEYFFYHVQDDLTNYDVYMPIINVPMDYVIIADDTNFHLVRDFLLNVDLPIHVHRARKNENQNLTSLSIKNAFKLYNEIKDIIPKESILQLLGENTSVDQNVKVMGFR
jgi:hypothetical protein